MNKISSGEGEQGEALLPCPFCGSDPSRRDWPAVRDRPMETMAFCPHCTFGWFDSKFWNTRAPSSTVAGAQEKEDRLKRALKAIWDFSANASPSVDLLNSISETCCRALSDSEKTQNIAREIIDCLEDENLKLNKQEWVNLVAQMISGKPEASADNVEAIRQKEADKLANIRSYLDRVHGECRCTLCELAQKITSP